MVKTIQYDPFGNILWDSNPSLRVPIGFAGGIHDPDTGFVQFGWRDYDPDTARWTAPDPIGDAGGDADWYGYCLDDPVNMADPSGLFAFIGPLLSGLAGATGIATLGAGGAALTADGLGALANKNEGDPFKATKGTAKAVAGAAAINAGIGATAASGAGIAKAVPAAVAAAPTIIRQGKEATKAVAGKGKAALKAGVEWAKANPDKIDKIGRIGADLLDPSLPETPQGQMIIATTKAGQRLYGEMQKKGKRTYENKESGLSNSGWWGR
ncbi:RHS repeat-associated core domain-containing protein [uncultured Pseudodesulfovibrio sp.]|uniref:RHS repeat-associated core domain-containing protein n=1 Tax=uncultured Pseudodesulfovibrio sp. TaxID=2035858 RepID=UPI0029C798DA|nr:RHS repeat-associated core domain-containing protein [uncultured Pseudodesulfovibrio sp.]